MSAARRRAAFARAARAYWLDVFPLARRELRRWRARAEAIPDPALRRGALFTHATKSGHSEGLAAFAVLAPPERRPAVVRATVAFELILDYLDTITEQPDLDDSLRLHRAFDVALDINARSEDYYALHPHRDDGGYLAAQIETCRAVLAALPSYLEAQEALRRCARFSREAQSFNHAIPYGLAQERVASWARETIAEIHLDREIPWWEVVAAGSSTLPAGVLIAAASDPRISAEQVSLIEAAYFPWIAALSSLLDCLIDLDDDRLAANHLNRYASRDDAAEHLASIAARSLELVSELPQAELHEIILAATGGYYLAQPNAWLSGSDRIARRVLEALGDYARPALLVHCVRQRTPRSALRAMRGGGDGS